MAERCTATSKQSGQRCRNWSTPGCSVCRFHGSASPAARRAAERRLAEERILADAEKARDLLVAEGVDTDTMVDIDAEFNRIIAEAITFKDILGGLVEQLRELEVTTNFNSPELRAIVAAYERGQDRVARMLTDYGKLNLSERKVRIAEGQAAVIAAVVQAALQAACDDPERIRRGQSVAAARLMELGRG